MIDLTDDEQVLAATIYGEARGESALGKQGVASVVLNRAAYASAHHRPQFGDGSIAAACLAPWQFSSWNKSDPNRAVIEALNFDSPDSILGGCIATAKAALAGDLDDVTGGALFYKVTTLPWPHDWGVEVAPIWAVGRHSFYVLP